MINPEGLPLAWSVPGWSAAPVEPAARVPPAAITECSSFHRIYSREKAYQRVVGLGFAGGVLLVEPGFAGGVQLLGFGFTGGVQLLGLGLLVELPEEFPPLGAAPASCTEIVEEVAATVNDVVCAWRP